jgi:hypothetical protein
MPVSCSVIFRRSRRAGGKALEHTQEAEDMPGAVRTGNPPRSGVSTYTLPLHTVVGLQSSWDSTSWVGTDHKTGAEGGLRKQAVEVVHRK